MKEDTTASGAAPEGLFPPADRAQWEALVGDSRREVDVATGVQVPALGTERGAVLPEAVRPKAGWRVWQVVDDPRMEVAQAFIRDDLAGGGEGAWIRCGLEHGTRVLTTGDLDLVLDAVDLGTTPVQLESETDALPLGAALLAIADAREVPREKLQGGLGADPLGALARSGTLPSGIAGALRDARELACLCRNLAGLRSGLVCTWVHHDAGADAVQEVAWAAATGLEYMRNLETAGLSTDGAANELRFAMGVSSEVFTEIAKLRAMRWVWAKVVAACGGSAPAQALELHARSSNAARTVRDPWVNMLRGSAETFAAVLGGADAISTAGYDRALASEDADARRLARSTQRVMRDEAYLARVDDAPGGSYTIEAMTREIARAAWTELQAIESMGGMVRAVRRGRIARALDAHRELVESSSRLRATPVVGVTHFANPSEAVVERPEVRLQDVEVELGNSFGSAGPEDRHNALIRFAEAIRDGGGAAEPTGDVGARAVDAMALGIDTYSVADVLRVGRPEGHAAPLRPLRPAALWEDLRGALDVFAQRNARPTAFFAAVGTLQQTRAQTEWVRGLLAAAGLGSDQSVERFDSREKAQSAAVESGATLVVITAGSESRAEVCSELAPALKSAGVRLVAHVGPPDADLRKQGVDFFFAPDEDPVSELVRLFRVMGIERGLPG